MSSAPQTQVTFLTHNAKHGFWLAICRLRWYCQRHALCKWQPLCASSRKSGPHHPQVKLDQHSCAQATHKNLLQNNAQRLVADKRTMTKRFFPSHSAFKWWKSHLDLKGGD